ncbi:MAG: TRAP transporter small permease [Firmicutes bacterium]|nr:TRAP transporter small permease [Bacillota bacterium]
MLKILEKTEEYICAFLLLFMAGLAFANVIVRYLTNGSLAFTEELIINLFVWITVLGGAIAFRKKAHLGVELVVNRLPIRGQKIAIVFGAICTVALFVSLFNQGIGLVAQEYKNQMVTYSMALPMWWFGLAVPFGAIIMMIHAVQAAIEELQTLSANQDKH